MEKIIQTEKSPMTFEKAMIKYNPYKFIVMAIAYLFYPLIYIRKVREDILPLLKMVNNLFINNIMGTFLALWYPMIFISILPMVADPQMIVFNIVSLVPTIVGVQVMPIIIVTLKNSSILKRIGATETKVSDLMISFVFYFAMVSLFSSFMNLGFGMAFHAEDMMYLKQVNYGGVFLAIAVGTIIGLTLGFFISGIVKTPNGAMVVGLTIAVPGSFFTGQFLPPSLINFMADGWINRISFIFPQKVAAEFMQVATFDSMSVNPILLQVPVFDDKGVIIYTKLQYAVNTSKSSMFDLKTMHNIATTETGSIFSTIDKFNALVASGTEIDSKIYYEIFAPFTSGYNGNVEATFVLSDNVTKLTAWILVPTYTGLFTTLALKTFRWGVR